MEGHVQALLAAAAIDHGAGANHDRPSRARHVHRLASGPARGHHVFDDQHFFTRLQGEAATQGQRAVLAFGKDGADAKGAADFLADHDAAERRR